MSRFDHFVNKLINNNLISIGVRYKCPAVHNQVAQMSLGRGLNKYFIQLTMHIFNVYTK